MKDNETLATQCYEKLTQAILSGQFLPGDRLRCEQLKELLNVGMSPVREALSRLATTPLVYFEEHKGYTVTKMTEAQVRDHILSLAHIETLCVKLAIEQACEAWEAAIVGTLHLLKKVETGKKVSYMSWAPLNAGFHNALISACPLDTLKSFRNQLYQQHQWLIYLSFKTADTAHIKANHKEHRDIAKAALAKNSKKAATLLFAHYTLNTDPLIEALKKRGLLHDQKE